MAITIDQERCVGCGCCSDACAAGALGLADTAVVYEDACVDCGRCIELCPALAISAG